MEKPVNLKPPEQYYKNLVHAMPQGYVRLQILFDEQQRPVELLCLEANEAASRILGMEVVGKRSSEVDQRHTRNLIPVFSRVALTGASERHELSATSTNTCYEYSVFKAGNADEHQVAVIFEDSAKRHRHITIKAIDKYLTLFNSIEQGFCTIEVLFDENNTATDYRFLEVNPAFEIETGLRNVIGKTIRELVSDTEEHWLRIYGEVAMSGVSCHFDGRADSLGRWFDVYAFRIDEPEKRRVALLFNDMSERKKAEEAYKINLEEEVRARTSQLKESRDLLDSILNTSLIAMSLMEAAYDKDGNIADFRLLVVNKQLEKQTGRTDLIGKYYAEEYPGIKITGIFDIMLRVMETGEPEGTEYFYPHEGLNKWFSCMFVKIDDGLVATNLDISERKKAEERIRQMETAQQREIFKVTLDAQEEERRRISESLHNGLGQLLYAVKISMNNLTFRSATQEQEEFHKAKKYTEGLLADAIRTTRQISHTLSPTILEDFGLRAAVKAICDQLENTTKFRCKVTLSDVHLDRFLELATFRIVQELLANAAKHADATDAYAEITAYVNAIAIIVQDNGKGFDMKKKGKGGIGLASIRSKVKLLKGSFSITSSPENGTTVKVRLPVYSKSS